MEWLLKYIKYLPQSINDILSLLSRPKSFLQDRLSDNPPDFSRAFAFLTLCAIVAAVLYAALSNPSNFLPRVVLEAIHLGILTVIASAAIYISWRTQRKELPISGIFTVNVYVVSVYVLFYNINALAYRTYAYMRFPQFLKPKNPLMTYEGRLYADMVNNFSPRLIEFYIAYTIYALFIYLLVGFCMVISWSAYRAVSGASRLRTLVAFSVSLLIGTPLLALADLSTMAIDVGAVHK